jgi:hypothetical protein
LVYADVNILGGSEHTMQKKSKALVAASQKIGAEGDADKSKYMVMSRDQNAGRSRNVKIDHSSSEWEEEFKYLGTNLTNKILCRKKLRAD